jgi:hypothetical protein
MIPNMFKIAGELSPTVFHVAARSINIDNRSLLLNYEVVSFAYSEKIINDVEAWMRRFINNAETCQRLQGYGVLQKTLCVYLLPSFNPKVACS